MAVILIVDDIAENREFLATLLGYGGHELLQAVDGNDALEIVRKRRPDLIISDLMMPTMDGFEFVRRLRAEPGLADIKVVFNTATYLESDARNLADACGVKHILTKPAEPEEVLRVVGDVLQGAPSPPPRTPAVGEFRAEHLRLISMTLAHKAEVVVPRLNAIIELSVQLSSELDPSRLLHMFCAGARKILGAKYAVVQLVRSARPADGRVFSSGLDAATAAAVPADWPLAGRLRAVVQERRPWRGRADSAALGLASGLPRAQTFVAVPVQSPKTVYGWLCLADRLGGDDFSADEEQLASTLAGLTGRVYENGSLYSAMRLHVDELRESEERFRQITSHVEEVFWMSDPAKKHMLYVSPAYEKIWGRTPESLYADPGHWLAAIHPEDRARVVASLAGQSTGDHNEEYRILRPDGTLRWVRDRGFPVRDARGAVYRVVGVAEDVTEQKLGAEALRVSEEKLKKAFESSPDGVLISRFSDGEILDVNAGFLAFLVRSREQVVGRTSVDLGLWAEARDYDVYMASLRERGSVRNMPFTCRDGTGALRGCFVSGEVLDLEGELLALTTIRDVSALQWAMDELRESERRFSGMLANLRLVSVMLDREARITYCNDFLLQLTGWRREEVLGRGWFEIFAPAELEHLPGLFSALLEDRPEAWHHEHEILTRSGKRRLVRWNNSVLRASSGEVVGTASIGEDITDQRRTEEQLRAAQKMEAVGRLAGGVAHDFNNVLGVIMGYGEMLRRGLPDQGSERHRVDEILRAAGRAAGLTRQLLAFSRKQVLEPRVLEPSALVVDMERMLGRLIGEDVELVLRPQATGRVKADPGQLEQVVMNLVVNARDAMPTGGRLTIETADVDLDQTYVQRRGEAVPVGRYVMTAVADTGQGMDDATQARLFEPFFTTKGEGKGTGLGLATVYGIVKQSRGYIWTYSEVGTGTVFRVYLPRVDEPKSEEQPRAPSVRRRGTETVLVVEDESAARELVAEILRGEGYSVLVSADGPEAVEAAARSSSPIDLLLTDVILPKLSGPAAAERIRSTHPRVKVLYMSGYTDDAISVHGVLQPGVAFLQKPFTVDELARRVGEILDGS